MPQFSPGQSKNAIVPATVTPGGLSCQLEVFLGPNESTKAATSGLKAFTSTGLQQSIVAPVVMPAAAGTYHVYIDLYAAGYYLAGYQATEDVVIASPALFSMGNMQVNFEQAGMGGPDNWYTKNTYTVDITNFGGEPATRKIRWWGTSPQIVPPQSGELNITIQPGEKHRWSLVQYMRGVEITYHLQGDWEGNNFTKATGYSYQWADCYGSLTRFPFCAKLTHYCDTAAGMCYKLVDGEWVRVS